MVEVVSTAVEDFTEVVGSTVEAGFMAGAASEAEWDSEAAAGFVAARSAEEGDFAEGEDFAVVNSAAAFAVTASAAAEAGADGVGEDEVGIGTIGGGASVLAGAGLMDIGPDMRIRTGMGTTPGGRRLITRPAMIPTTILTTTLRPPIPRLPTRIEIIHTGTTGTGMLRGRARRRGPTTGTTGRRPHRAIPGRHRWIPTVRRARMA
jgi:hypothetical protein